MTTETGKKRIIFSLVALGSSGGPAASRQVDVQSNLNRPTPIVRSVKDVNLTPPGYQLVDTRTLAEIPVEQVGLKEILSLPPNLNLPAVNFSMIPQYHRPDEHIFMASNYQDVGIGIYGSGIEQAIARGQDATLVLEQPPKEKYQHDSKHPEYWQATLQQWRDYVQAAVSRYRPKNFIIGNEVNAPEVHPESVPLADYLELYQIAWEEIKKASPQTRVFLYGESYCGNGEYLTALLERLNKAGIPFDGLAVHFYDVAAELPARIALYQKILPVGKPIIISELGLPQTFSSYPRRISEMIKLMASAAQLIESRAVEQAAWFAAFSHSAPQHSLYRIPGKQIVESSAALPWLMAARFLYRRVAIENARGITIVRGETAYGQPTKIAWSNSGRRVVYPLSEKERAFDYQGHQIDSKDKRLIALTGYPTFILS